MKDKKRIVVIGNGMVGLRFCEQLIEHDAEGQYELTTFCEEPRAAYDRVGLTSFFAHRDAEKLMLTRLEWYQENNVDLHLGDRASAIDRKAKLVKSDYGVNIPYDYVVLATGSYPFVPSVPGVDQKGVFVYRTIEDLKHIIDHAKKSKSAAVIGGGLLGLEAAKATHDLGLETHVIEYNARLMPRQLDDAGSKILAQKIEALDVQVHLNKSTKEIHGSGSVQQIEFADGERLDVDMIIVSCGIRPRDELAQAAGLDVHQRGGVVVSDMLQTSDPDIFAIGEVALHAGRVYGLVAPGYEMAEILAMNFTGSQAAFTGAELSTKLKLMGVDVASFGDHEADTDAATPITFEDSIGGHYKKLLFSRDGSRLLGGILVGDATDYGKLSIMAKAGEPLTCSPHELIIGSDAGMPLGGADSMPDDAQVCCCNNVLKRDICDAVSDRELTTIGQLKSRTKAGTGCGGCIPMITELLNDELKKSGETVTNQLCEHFAYNRTELLAILKAKTLQTFD